MNIFKSYQNTGRVLAMASLMAISFSLQAEIPGGVVLDLYAKYGHINTPDGDTFQIWGFADDATKEAQYPGPTIIVDEGDTVRITLHNDNVSQQPVSLVFPGQGKIHKECLGVVAQNEPGCYLNTVDGSNVVNAGLNQSITYTFTASKPGTYMYHSGVSPQIQIDMGLVGTLIVRPSMVADGTVGADGGLAYNNKLTAYDQEYLFFLSEMDPKLHYLAENNALDQWDNADYNSVLFFINGRNAPDTLAGDFLPQFPHQPYGSLVQMFPGERLLIRTVNAGRNQHPLHLHGNHFDQIARDGNLLATTTAKGNLGIADYTLGAVPGSTADMLFTWTGKGMGWDIYNSETAHGSCTDAVNNRTLAPGSDGFADDIPDQIAWEWCDDHGKVLPVVLPENQDLGFGGFYGGSPYLGDVGSLPIGEGGLNPAGGMVFMWHSHSERELTNNDIYPGGMLTMMIVNRR